ncbi:MAG: hydantoinase/oxoprolinase family protein [Pseudomonadota bacterium]|nr:hydantoinase/oxoprolinase family protein [Pseudomonadota bacterium]
MIVGIEVGGTFTDLVMADGNGRLTVHKLPSTPADPSIAAVDGLEQILKKNDQSADGITELLHGSTIAANALIQRRGAQTVLITTKGFRDVLFIQRQDKSTVYDMFYQKPEPLLSRERVLEVEERMSASGDVVIPLDEKTTEMLIDEIAAEHAPDSIAVCLLHAYANPTHEQILGRIIGHRHPNIRVSLSSDVAPEHREYERTSTAVIDAYIGPAVDRYLARFGERTAQVGVSSKPLIMQSNGGVVPLETARQRAANMFVSGPAAAVTAAAEVARREEVLDVISIDIGGTSCDVCLITGGRPQTTVKGTSEFSVDGLPLNVVMTDIVTIGAGGGSIALIDAGGMLQVGPESAGADPGPACYGKGGKKFTMTDAMLLLGLLDAGKPLPGNILLRSNLSEAAAAELCGNFNLTPVELAERVYRIAIANMAQAVRRVSVQRGFDPRTYALLPCGGAGPLIAAALANEVGMDTILIPPHPGIFSALGLAVADIRIDYVRADGVLRLAELTAEDLTNRIEDLRGRAHSEFSQLGYTPDEVVLEFAVDARYVGQGYELRVPFGLEMAAAGTKQLIARFHDLHQRQYGHSFEHSAVEAISFRLTARRIRRSVLAAPEISERPQSDDSREISLLGERAHYRSYQREDLPAGFKACGPTVVVESTTTIPIPPDWHFEVTKGGAIIAKRSGA